MRVLGLLLLVLGCAHMGQAGLAHWMEAKICQMVVGHLESSANSWACGEITAEVTGVAASMLAETSFAEIVEDPIIAGVTDHICDRALSYIENHWGVGPSEVCDDLGLAMRRRRDVDSVATTASTATTASSASTTAAPSSGQISEAGFQRIMTHRMHKLHQRGTPVAVFSDGSIGYCFPDPDTGMYSCMESGLSDQLAAKNPATSLVSSSAASGSGSSTSSSGLSTGAVVAISMLSTFLAIAGVACVALVIKLRAQSAAKAAASAGRYAGGAMEEHLLPASNI